MSAEREKYTDAQRLDALDRWGISFARGSSFSEETVEVEVFQECPDEECDGSDCQCPGQEWSVVGAQDIDGSWPHGHGTTLRDAIDEALDREEAAKARRARFVEEVDCA